MILERQVSIEIQCNYVLINAQKGIPKSCNILHLLTFGFLVLVPYYHAFWHMHL